MSRINFNVNWERLCYNCSAPLNISVTFYSLEIYTLFHLFTAAFKLNLETNVIRRKHNGETILPFCVCCRNFLKQSYNYIVNRELNCRKFISRSKSCEDVYNYFELFNKYLSRKDDIYWRDFLSGEIYIRNLNIFVKFGYHLLMSNDYTNDDESSDENSNDDDSNSNISFTSLFSDIEDSLT